MNLRILIKSEILMINIEKLYSFYRVESFVGTRHELDEYVERYGKKPEER